MNRPSFDPNAHPSAKRILDDIRSKDASFWRRRSERNGLRLFHEAATRVPAYKDFLKKKKVSPSDIVNAQDLRFLPITNKKEYINAYPIKDLAWDGRLDRASVFTSTSGSTGEQTYFFRSSLVDWQNSVIQEFFLQNGRDPARSTLVVICFGMGIWIGGLITYEAMSRLAERGYPLSVITPGINKAEIFKILKRIAPAYDQTIIYGYPPFIKDLIDEAPLSGVNLKKLDVRFSTAAEAYSEDFRDFLSRSAKLRDPALDVMSIYGSADIGGMAFETPTAIGIRRLAMKQKALFADVFGPIEKTPTLAQFVPGFVDFRSEDGQLYLTGNSSIPLINYAIGDNGGVISHDEMEATLSRYGESIPRNKRDTFASNRLPFVYVFERNDMSTSLYGAQIYPEAIREVLIKRQFSKMLSGKFTLVTKFDAKHDQYLELNLELSRNGSANRIFKAQLLANILKNLTHKNSEFKELSKFIGTRAHPRLVFWQHEDPTYFKPGIKQQWVKRIV